MEDTDSSRFRWDPRSERDALFLADQILSVEPIRVTGSLPGRLPSPTRVFPGGVSSHLADSIPV